METREIWHSARRATGPAPEAVAAFRSKRSDRLWPRALVVADVVASVARDMRQAAGVTRLPGALRERADAVARVAVDARRAAMVRTAAPDLRGRWMLRMQGQMLLEAARRGLPVVVDCARAADQPVRLESMRRTDEGYWVGLLRGEGWADYGSRMPRKLKSVALLAGRDDAGWWAVRVPGSIDSVEAGLLWLEPAAVRQARAEGKRVLRQGDVWIVERARDGMGKGRLPFGHEWDEATRTLKHGAHNVVHVPWPATAIPQNTLAPNGVGRRSAD